MGLAQLDGSVFLTDGGVETDLIFNRGMDLPEFASFVLHENAEGEAVLREYYAEYLAIGATTGWIRHLETSKAPDPYWKKPGQQLPEDATPGSKHRRT
jgi:hypothetical protein